MKYHTASAAAVLARTPSVLRVLLLDLPEEWLEAPEAPNAWSPRDVACHMADLERDAWLPRLQVILEGGTAAVLPGVDRERFRVTYDRVPIREVLVDFDRLRRSNLTARYHEAVGPWREYFSVLRPRS